MGLGSGRDFLGYGRDMPQASWPGDAKIAVSFVVNFEEGAEFAISDGDPTNEAIYEVERRLDGLSGRQAGRSGPEGGGERPTLLHCYARRADADGACRAGSIARLG